LKSFELKKKEKKQNLEKNCNDYYSELFFSSLLFVEEMPAEIPNLVLKYLIRH